jgi:hypothetical protein
MAPKSLLKTLKYKPIPKLTLDPPPVAEKETVSTWVKPTRVIPESTSQELEAWALARARQKSDEAGNPVEGWAARIAAMKADGRLVECDGAWRQRC